MDGWMRCGYCLDKAFGIIFESIMGNNSTLFGESLNMISFLAQVGFWYEKWEISVLMPGFLKHLVQLLLHRADTKSRP